LSIQHLIELEEGAWTEERFQLTDRDRRLLSQFNSGPNGDLVVQELKDSVRIGALSSIGVVRFDSFEVRIYPKIAKSNMRVVQMLGLTRGVDLLRRFKHHPFIAADDHSLFDLIIILLVEETQKLIRHGLLSSYKEHEELLPMMRGRLLSDKQLLERFGVLDRLHCRFDELTTNNPENQLLAKALMSSVSLVSNALLRTRVQSCLGDLLVNCSQLDEAVQELKAIHYDRLNQHYRIAHELCWLVLSQSGIKDLFDNGSTKCFSFLINMPKLFEEFAEAVIRILFQGYGYRVKSQSQSSTVIRDANTGEVYANVIPDLQLFLPNGIGYCIDAKYKLYDQKKISSADIYQLFLYSFAYAKESSNRRSIFLFPSETSEPIKHQLSIHCADGSIGWVTGIGIHIPTVLDELKSNKSSSLKQAILDTFTLM
jgi:5-methylcytosine-specific restriction enzyme subunit McrC